MFVTRGLHSSRQAKPLECGGLAPLWSSAERGPGVVKHDVLVRTVSERFQVLEFADGLPSRFTSMAQSS